METLHLMRTEARPSSIEVPTRGPKRRSSLERRGLKTGRDAPTNGFAGSHQRR